MLTASRLRELLAYDPDTGVFTWRTRTSNRCHVGSEAGYVEPDGRRQIRIEGKLYRAHRLAWLYAHGRWPADQIDHINNDRGDNRLCNLREANNQQNHYNQPLKKSNKSGYKGVFYWKKRNVYRAEIRVQGRSRHIGCFKTAEEAHEAYKAAAIKYHGEFAKF